MKPNNDLQPEPVAPVPPAAVRARFTLSVRAGLDNPDHHIWNNNGTWWIAVTVVHADTTTERIRRSLRTRDRLEARRRRDAVFRDLGWGGAALAPEGDEALEPA